MTSVVNGKLSLGGGPATREDSAATQPDLPSSPKHDAGMASSSTRTQGVVYLATYADVQVFELEVQGMPVMRRVKDSALNATQILKLAGVDKAKRTKSLELIGDHEKVQGGYGPFQGTWVPFETGVKLAQQYNVYNLLYPLFYHDSNLRDTPSKDLARALAERAPHIQEALPPIDQANPLFDRSRQVVTDIFLNQENPNLDELLVNQSGPVEMDVPIDDAGHTALHWAAALGSIQLVKELVRHGSQPTRGNYQGETALIRSVLVTNNSDLCTFSELLEYLGEALFVKDHNGRTVLHHISLTAGIRGRSDASRYYLETLMEYAVSTNQFEAFNATLINAQDYNGDTALNIAARVGNCCIARHFVDVGADTLIPNRAGLRPVDFGIESDQSRQPAASAPVLNGNGITGTEKRKQLFDAVISTLQSLESNFERELDEKQALISRVHTQLRDATTTLDQYRSQANHLSDLATQLNDFQRGSASLDAAISQEDGRFRREEIQAGREPIGIDNEFDPDEPFRVSQADVTKIPPVIWEARIAAYKENMRSLEGFRDDLRRRSAQLESKFRRVVSLSTGVPESEIDGMLDGFVQAVESDGAAVDLARISSFLQKINT